MDEIEDLMDQIKSFLECVNDKNFNESYMGAIELLESYRGKGLEKEDVIQSLNTLPSKWKMESYQRDVFWELCYRLEGLSSDQNNIVWF